MLLQELIEIEKKKARDEALEEGREEGRAEGREEGRAEGREEGRAEGREEGRAEGALIHFRDFVLRVAKVNDSDDNLIERIEQCEDLSELERIHADILRIH